MTWAGGAWWPPSPTRTATCWGCSRTVEPGWLVGAEAGWIEWASRRVTVRAVPGTDGDTMSRATKTDKQSADRYDLIRVRGARVNNLKDVSVELPKRRLTV